jgi:hypothetical protein
MGYRKQLGLCSTKSIQRIFIRQNYRNLYYPLGSLSSWPVIHVLQAYVSDPTVKSEIGLTHRDLRDRLAVARSQAVARIHRLRFMLRHQS